MELGKKVVNSITVLELGGSAQAPPLIQALDGELRGAISLDSLKVLLDVAKVDFIDSATLEALVSFQKKYAQVNATLAFVNMTDYLKKVFEIVRIGELFTSYDDMDAAMKAIRTRRR